LEDDIKTELQVILRNGCRLNWCGSEEGQVTSCETGIQRSTLQFGEFDHKTFFTVASSFHSSLRSSSLGCLNSQNFWGLLRSRLSKLGVRVKKSSNFWGLLRRRLETRSCGKKFPEFLGTTSKETVETRN
jgi:hypothetical protein